MKKNDPVLTTYKDSKSNYTYASDDLSILDCSIIVPLARKLVNKFPLWLPANIITIVSNSLVLLASAIALSARRTNWPIWILIPICFLVYLIGDTSDGLQARRTKTGSPLGEFCDHFLDSFVTAELMFCVFTAFGIRNLAFVGACLYVSYITQMAAFWEKYVTGHLHFGKFGSSESLIVMSLFATIGFIPPVHRFFTRPTPIAIPFLNGYHVNIVEIILVVSALFCIVSIILTFIRTKKVSLNFILYLILGIILTVAATFLERGSFPIAFLTLTFYHVDYSAALLSAIIMKEKDPKPDFLLTAAMCIALFFNIHHPVLYTVFFLYIVVFVTARAAMFIYKNGKYWYWVNPPLPAEDAATTSATATDATATASATETKTETTE